MVDGVDEPDSHVRMVVRHQNNVKQFFTLRVQLPQTSIDRLQSLSGHSTSQLRSSGQHKKLNVLSENQSLHCTCYVCEGMFVWL